LGFDAVFVNDHIIVDRSPRSAPSTKYLRSFRFAVVCRREYIGLGVSVLIMPYRNRSAIAKMLVTLDQTSSGRLITGDGVGWNESELKELGVPFQERGARTTESLRIWQVCLAPGMVLFDGGFFSFDNMPVSPSRHASHIRPSGSEVSVTPRRGVRRRFAA
jgi:alkanesulfonate monooxygenase SsuD/methylene tetrahydromethanopterin reductase-like flavin-dependent oxidoreductase (luciferase family)